MGRNSFYCFFFGFPKSYTKPDTNKQKSLANIEFARLFVVLPGFEPRITVPKTAVLPLHYKTRCVSKNNAAKIYTFFFLPKFLTRFFHFLSHEILLMSLFQRFISLIYWTKNHRLLIGSFVATNTKLIRYG